HPEEWRERVPTRFVDSCVLSSDTSCVSAVTTMNIPLEQHSVCNDAPNDAPMTLHPYTRVHERMEVGESQGADGRIPHRQLRSGHSLKGWKEVPFQMERAVGASKLHLN